MYINPNYYASSSVAVFILSDLQTNCVGSELGCFLQSGVYLLRQFNFDNVNPYIHFLVSLKVQYMDSKFPLNPSCNCGGLQDGQFT